MTYQVPAFECKNCGRLSGFPPEAFTWRGTKVRLLTKKERLSGKYGWDVLGRVPDGAKSVIQCIYCGSGLLCGTFFRELVSREFCEDMRKAIGIESGVYGDKNEVAANEAAQHFNLGFSFFEKHEFDSAISEYQKAIRLKPDYPAAHHNLGCAYGNKGLEDMAIKHFLEAIRIGPDLTWSDPRANVYHDLAVAYARKGQFGEAKQAVERGLKIRPTDARLRNLLDKLY